MKDNITNLQEIKNTVRDFVSSRNWTSSHNPKNLAMCIAIEAAELMEIFQWLSIEESDKINESSEAVHLGEELSDVLWYCASLANQLALDISAAITDKMEKNVGRFPGNSNVRIMQMNDYTTSLEEIKDTIKEFIDSRGWSKNQSPKNLAMSIAIEAGELMEIFQWLTIEDSYKVNTSTVATNLRDELADILIYLCSLANNLNIDIATVFKDKLIKNAKRFPPEREIDEDQANLK